MDILLLTVGKTTQPYVIEGIDEYLKRLKRYTSYKIECLPDVKCTRSLTPDQQKEKEGENILSSISQSVEFAGYLQKIMASGRKRALFVVGGPYGFSKAVYERADAKISLSKMTFTHEMIRLFFTEQVYRAMTILRGEPYHHE